MGVDVVECLLFVSLLSIVFLDNDVAGLPDAVDAYASMAKLVQINVSNSKSLDRAPLGWAYVPNDNIAIDVHGSKQFFDLPFKLCSSHANLRSLDVSGTVAETTMNWTGQLSGANGSSFDVGSVNDACVIALKKLTSLSLAGNNLTNRYCAVVPCGLAWVVVGLTFVVLYDFPSQVKLTMYCFRNWIHCSL